MNALDKIGMNLMPLRLDTMLSGIGAGSGARTAGADGGSISQQPNTLNGSPDSNAFAAAPRALPAASTQATVSVDARVLDALSRLPGELPLIQASKPLCPVPPRDAAAAVQNTAGGTSGSGAGARPALIVVGAPQSANATPAAGAAPVASSAFTALLARALQQTLENSGLFYESHLAQWAGGQRPITDLDREPQSHLAPLDGPAAPGQADDAQDDGPSATLEFLPQALNHALHNALPPVLQNALQNALHYARANGLEFVGGESPPAASPGPFGRAGTGDGAVGMADHAADSAARLVDAIHPDIVSTVRQQMELLQNPVLRWSGEAWPGTRMDWEIERRDERREDGAAWNSGEPAEPSWRMQVSLNLPHLGTVDADLQLAGSRLVARLKAQPDSAASLLHDSDDLRRRLAGTGLELKSLAVRETPDASRQRAS
ncbi:flagellar hook-length control protein FliK [Robbsia sp. Bb-Pol-6]|uniref:Flagellar hook-length control protein FliK n=1 Tax=Robbsia betulipollinis TaxID=2981849 RepID=A0ABT3ZHS4_9BURK|nr:flagellar hook-length control protein FliK [Robbsia betulipollinis]MCY0385972.1 flagellar hook-length control protein FliK [Robbsia betulipollinis]